MSAAEVVNCDRCDYRVRLRRDGTYASHTLGSLTTALCEYSGKPYARHMGSFRVTQRGPDNVATEWIAECRCGRVWLGPEYDAVEQLWRDHTRSGAR